MDFIDEIMGDEEEQPPQRKALKLASFQDLRVAAAEIFNLEWTGQLESKESQSHLKSLSMVRDIWGSSGGKDSSNEFSADLDELRMTSDELNAWELEEKLRLKNETRAEMERENDSDQDDQF